MTNVLLSRQGTWRAALACSVAVFGLAVLTSMQSFSAVWAETAAPMGIPGDGVISGTVRIDQGSVVGFRVKARDTQRQITYMTYTKGGQYRLYNLPAGRYEVQVLEDNVTSPVRAVDLAAGGTAVADLSLTATPGAVIGFSPRTVGEVSRRSTVGNQAAGGQAVEMAKVVDFDTLYPPGRARDVLVDRCFGCHGPGGWHNRGGGTEAQWAARVERMFGNVNFNQLGTPVIEPGTISAEDKQAIIKYLATNFPPRHEQRDLALDPIVRNEDELSKSLWVQYDLAPIDPKEAEGVRNARRGTHDAYPSRLMPGIVWMAGFGSGSYVRVDTRDPNVATRTKDYFVKVADGMMVGLHAVNEYEDKVYATQMYNNQVGELDVKTGAVTQYPTKTPGGMHTLRVDSKGRVFYTEIAGTLGVWDPITKETKEYNPIPGANWYGVTVDTKDRAWAVGVSRKALAMWDPKTERWTAVPVPGNVRRTSVDNKGNLWLNQYFDNAVLRVNTDNPHEIEQFKLPLKWGNPYAVAADANGSVYVENQMYNSIVRLDTASKQWTYYPFPAARAHTPMLEPGDDGTIWFGLGGGPGGAPTLTAFHPNGNVPKSQRATR